MHSSHLNRQSKQGFTLVEILVVLVIATIVMSLAIPRIRTINKERNTREAARVVGSAFANAGQRARIDGVAGVRITQNPNFEQGGFNFAVTELSLLRKVPNYAGDVENSQITASSSSASTVTIPRPLEQDELNIVRVGDSISFSSSSNKYRIERVTGSGALTLTLNRGRNNYMPIPAFTAGADNPTYVVHRLPRLLRSSKTELPDNYIVDMRFSGFEVLDGTGQRTRVFEPAIAGTPIDFIFDEDGAIDRIFYSDAAATSREPLGPLYFLVTEAPDSTEMGEPVATQDPTSLWVSISSLSGSTNVGYNNSGPSAGQTYQSMSDLFNNDRNDFNTMIENCRDNSLSSSANQ